MKRPGSPGVSTYTSHTRRWTPTTVSSLVVTVTPGDVYDSVPYLDQLEHVHRAVLPIQAAAADAAYDFPLAHRALDELGIRFFVRPQTAHDRTGVELKRDAFRYEESLDAYVCPNDKLLKLNTLHRSASGLYWLYLADRRDCQSCPLRPQCLRPEDRRGARKLEHSYFMSQRRKKPGAAYPAGVPGGAEAAADLVRGLFCHPEALPQFNTAFAAGTRGSGGPLPPFRHGLEPQKD